MFRTKSISVKLGLAFLILTLLIETLLFSTLYVSLVKTRVDEEIHSLITRGNSHRDVLEKHFTSETIKHVALMESEAETKVVIQSVDEKILGKSHPLDSLMKEHLSLNKSHIKENGSIIHSDWKGDNYISTVSPINLNNRTAGYVYMFLNTKSIQALIFRLKMIFLLTGVITFLITIITTLFLSKSLTKPLISMKEETEKMAKGNLSVAFDMQSNDEISDLANSIQKLASELDFIKKERNEFLATVAHELRTPLTFIRGYADLASKDSVKDSERNEYLHIIKEEIDRITELVQDLMFLAQSEHHNFIIHKTKHCVYDLLRNVHDKLSSILLEKNITLDIHCHMDTYVNMDVNRFYQVLQNLLMNSYQYAYKHSTITIKVMEQLDCLVMTIEDEGVGIPAEDLPHIFKRFYRVDKSRTRSTGGTGLGLAVVKEIIELHNGTIEAESELEKGTTFIISIPCE